MSPPLSLTFGTLELPAQVLEPTPITSNHTTEPTLSRNVSTVYTQPLSSTLKTPRSPIPPPTNLPLTFDNCSYTIPQRKNILFSKTLPLLILVFFLQLSILVTIHPKVTP